MENLLEKFITQINAMLDECTPKYTPTVCNMISTIEGRQKVLVLIQKKVIEEKITIGQAINSLEQEFNINSYAE